MSNWRAQRSVTPAREAGPDGAEEGVAEVEADDVADALADNALPLPQSDVPVDRVDSALVVTANF